MTRATSTPQAGYTEIRQNEHPNCFACGSHPNAGLGVRFRVQQGGLVEATFDCQRRFEGYPDVLHGGVVCMLLDSAMTNCLFQSGVVAVTGDMQVRFRQPIATKGQVKVRAWIEASQNPLFKVASEIVQDGILKASGKARFVERSTAAQLATEQRW